MFGLYLGSYDSIYCRVSDYIILYDWICVLDGYCSLESVKENQKKTIHRNPILSAPATRIVMEFSSSSKHLLSLGTFLSTKNTSKTPNLEVFAWMSRKKKKSPNRRESLLSYKINSNCGAWGGILGGFGRKIRWVGVPKKTCCDPR